MMKTVILGVLAVAASGSALAQGGWAFEFKSGANDCVVTSPDFYLLDKKHKGYKANLMAFHTEMGVALVLQANKRLNPNLSYQWLEITGGKGTTATRFDIKVGTSDRDLAFDQNRSSTFFHVLLPRAKAIRLKIMFDGTPQSLPTNTVNMSRFADMKKAYDTCAKAIKD